MPEVAHECYRCHRIIKFEDYQERHYKFTMEGDIQLRSIYFMICEDCSKEKENELLETQ